MNHQEDILRNFDSVLSSIKKMEENAAIFSELSRISSELNSLKDFIQQGLENLNTDYDSFTHSINTLSDIVDFQKKVLNYRSTDKTVEEIFNFLKLHIPHDDAFLIYKLKEEDPSYEILAPDSERREVYHKFVNSSRIDQLLSIFQNGELSHLIQDTADFHSDSVSWTHLDAKSVIVFSLKVRGHLFGLGFLIRRNASFEFKDLSLINAMNIMIALLVYHGFYFAWVKARLIQQARHLKILDDVKFADFFEKGPIFLFTLDPRAVILHANTSALEFLENSGDSIIGEDFFELIPPNQRPSFKKFLTEHHHKNTGVFRSPIMARNGRTPVMEFLVSQVRVGKEADLNLVLATDVTETFHRETIRRRNEVLDEIDQFSRILVTQFNNLLTTIVPAINSVRLSLGAKDPNQQRLEMVELAARRSANLVQKFLNYDVEAQDSAEEGNLNKILSGYLNSARKNIPSHIKVRFEADSDIKNTRLYPLKIRRVLDILISNSVIALQGKENPTINVSTSLVHQLEDGLVNQKSFSLKKGDYIELCVWDNGIGIPEKSLTEVLKPFYSTRIKNEGVGLELFIAYNLVKDMKGALFMDSEVDKYTAAHVYLPFKEEKSMATRTVGVEKPQPEVQPQKATVLVVDDEYNIRSMMKEIMEMSGFKVLTAGNGRDGIDIYQRYKNEIDLIIMDMVMPVMDGRAAFNEIRKINPDQKIFIISGYTQREDLEDILENGAVGFLRKPFQVKEIVEKVQEILKTRNS
jgi:PAS domain S-box-containing protein